MLGVAAIRDVEIPLRVDGEPPRVFEPGNDGGAGRFAIGIHLNHVFSSGQEDFSVVNGEAVGRGDAHRVQDLAAFRIDDEEFVIQQNRDVEASVMERHAFGLRDPAAFPKPFGGLVCVCRKIAEDFSTGRVGEIVFADEEPF